MASASCYRARARLKAKRRASGSNVGHSASVAVERSVWSNALGVGYYAGTCPPERWFIASVFRMFLPTHDQDDGDVQGALLAKSGRLLSIACSTEDIVAILRAHARSIVGSDGIAVVLRDGDQCFYAAEDAIEPLWRGQRFPMSSCVSGWAMLNKRTVVIPDIESDPRVPQVAYQRTSMRTLAMVPLGEPEPVAALGAYWCAYIEPDDATVRRLEILARMAAIAFGRIAAMPAAKDALDR